MILQNKQGKEWKTKRGGISGQGNTYFLKRTMEFRKENGIPSKIRSKVAQVEGEGSGRRKIYC